LTINTVNASPTNPSWFYNGWQYRKAHDLTATPQTTVPTNFFNVSTAVSTIAGNPNTQHAFEPVHNSTIIEVDKQIDGNTWKYLAYDCDPGGSLINLFYSNDTSGTWIPYSQNPILGPSADYFRWPSTTYVNGTFYMFLEDYTGGTLERWSSTDGIHYIFVENVISGGNPYKNPFIWFNTNDNKWYLYSHDAISTGVGESLKVRSATTLSGLSTTTDTTILTQNIPFGSPTMMYYNGEYWLLGEIMVGSQWQIVAYYSTTFPSLGFVQATNSPVLTNDEACPMVFLMPDQTHAYLYETDNSSAWYENTRQINLTSQVSPPHQPVSLITK